MAGNYWGWPKSFNFVENYTAVFTQTAMARYFLDSLIITLPSVLGVRMLSTFAGYVLSRHRFRGANLMFAFDDLAAPPSKVDTVTVGIRPEKLRTGGAACGVAVVGQVRLTKYLGRETIVYVDAGELATSVPSRPAHPFRSALTRAMAISLLPTAEPSTLPSPSQVSEQG